MYLTLTQTIEGTFVPIGGVHVEHSNICDAFLFALQPAFLGQTVQIVVASSRLPVTSPFKVWPRHDQEG